MVSHSFSIGEHRTIRFAPVEKPAPQAPKLQEMVQSLEQNLRAEIAANPAVAPEIAKLKAATAERDEQKLKDQYSDGVTKLAKVVFAAKVAVPGSNPEQVKNELQNQLQNVAQLSLDGAGTLTVNVLELKVAMDPAQKEAMERGLQNSPPLFRKAAMDAAEELCDPTKNALAVRVVESFNAITDRTAHRCAVQVAVGRISLSKISDPKSRAQVEQFLSAIGDDGKDYLKRTADKFKQHMTEEKEENDSEQGKELATRALEIYGKFNPTKASEIDKNIMLARLRMEGVDASEDAFDASKSPAERFPLFTGENWERALNKIAGLIGYISLTFEKIKGATKQAIGDKESGKTTVAATPVDKEEARAKLRAEMDTLPGTPANRGEQLLVNKKKALEDPTNGVNQKIIEKSTLIGMLEAKVLADPTDAASKEQLRITQSLLTSLKDQQNKLKSEIADLEAMKKDAVDQAKEATQYVSNIDQLSKVSPAVAAKPRINQASQCKFGIDEHFNVCLVGPAPIMALEAMQSLMKTEINKGPAESIAVKPGTPIVVDPKMASIALQELYKKLNA